ncbi:MAG TPA: hypothetical protein DCY00_03220 [Actinobacteria bacterium]|nr:hypothetical protein [Actinomycetota bacterium]
MNQVMAGFISGAVAGIVMGLISDALLRLNIFKFSLIIIDGSFMFRTLKLKDHPPLLYTAGLLIHLITSGIFGGIYTTVATITDFDILSPWLVSLYVGLLWFSMIFIALPVAGEGPLGRKSGKLS